LNFTSDGKLLVADSYNDALKWVNPASKSAMSWVKGLNEPGGGACDADHACVADTSAHRIMAVSYRTGEPRTLRLE
jgi:hypothetical protein